MGNCSVNSACAEVVKAVLAVLDGCIFMQMLLHVIFVAVALPRSTVCE